MSGKQEPAATSRGDAVKYGELIVLGYNGSLPDGDRGRRKSRFALHRRAKANGVQPSSSHITTAIQECKAVSSKEQHSISYGLSRSHVVVVEYVHDPDQDMYLVGRSGEAPVDFVVMDTAPRKSPGGGGGDGGSSTGSGDSPTAQSTISRFACRILCERSPPHRARVYAAGFDSSNNIFLGERATKWRDADGSMDGLTTNGVLVMHPRGGGGGGGGGGGELSELVQPGVWREVSVGGKVYTLRETRSAQHRGCLVETESNELQDGSLVDLCGATLLWRTAEGLRRSPTVRHIELLRQELNAARPQCPVGLNTLAFPSTAQQQQQQQQRRMGGAAGGGGGRYVARPDARQPWAYLTCGHVHGRHDWGLREDAAAAAAGAGGTGAAWQRQQQQQDQRRECPVCRSLGPYVALSLGCEAGFYVDGEAPTHALTPCGHVCSERTARYWAAVPLPHGTHAFHATCPFCAAQLTGEQGFVRLIFQGPVD